MSDYTEEARREDREDIKAHMDAPTTSNLSRSHQKRWAYVLYFLAGGVMLYGSFQTSRADHLYRLMTAFYNSTDQAISIIDSKGAVVIWSKGSENLLGWSPKEAQGHQIAMLVPMNMLARHSEKFEDRINKIKNEGLQDNAKTMVVRCEAMTKGLDKIPLRITLRFFEFEGEPYINAAFDKADEVEFLKAPPSEPVQSSSSLFSGTHG